MKRNLFILGFAIGISIFVGINLYSYHVAEPPCCDGFAYFGFPLQYGTFGGYAGYTGYKLDLWLLNSVIGGVFSAAFALFLGRLVPPLRSFARDVVAWHTNTRLS